MTIDPHHDGIMLKPAIDVAQRKMLFRDTFTQYGALTTLLQSLAIKIFGQYLIVIRLLTAFFYALTSIFLWLVLSRFLPKWLVSLSCIVWVFLAPYFEFGFIPWSSVYALFFQMLSAYLIIRYLETEKKSFLVTTGITTALTFWSKQSVGIFLFSAIIFFLLFIFLFKKIGVKQIILFLCGFFSICFVFLIWLKVNNALDDWWLQSVQYSLLWSKSYGGGKFNLQMILSSLLLFLKGPWSIWSLLPIVSLQIFIFIFLKTFISQKITKQEMIVLSLTFISLSSWSQYYPISDPRHFYWAATPMIGLVIYFFWTIISSIFSSKTSINKAVKYVIFFLILYFLLFPDIKYKIKKGVDKIRQNYVQIEKPSVLKYMKLTKSEAFFYENTAKTIDNYLKSYPNKELITNGRNALYLTFTNKVGNYHPFYINAESYIPILYPDYPKKLNDYIEKKQPLLVTENPNLPYNYCRLNNYVNWDGVFLAVPCSSLEK